MPDLIAEMLANRRLERVAINLDHALHVIVVAERHLRSAEALAAADDHAMAFTAAYDAARVRLDAPGAQRDRVPAGRPRCSDGAGRR